MTIKQTVKTSLHLYKAYHFLLCNKAVELAKTRHPISCKWHSQHFLNWKLSICDKELIYKQYPTVIF